MPATARKGKSRVNKGGATSSTNQTTTAVSNTDSDASGSQTKSGGSSRTLSGVGSFDDVDYRTDTEKKLFELIKAEKASQVKKLIKANKADLNPNVKDLDGDSLFVNAVKTKHISIVRAVLNINPLEIDAREGVLKAIEDGDVEFVGQLLYLVDSEAKLFKLSKVTHEKHKGNMPDWFLQVDQNKYGSGITPMIQAAKHGHYEIMELLYDRGERLRKEHLHMPQCKCRQCKKMPTDLEKTTRRLDTLKGLTNPYYMIFMASKYGSYDPVFEAMELTGKLTECIQKEPEFKKDYEELKEEVEKLPVELMKLCRTTEETKVFLSPREGYVGPLSNPYPRLAYAIQQGHKKFVAESNVQFLIHSEFKAGYDYMFEANPMGFCGDFKNWFKLAIVVLLAPVWAVMMYIFQCLDCNIKKFYFGPFGKALLKLGTHLWFCALLFYMCVQDRPEADYRPPGLYLGIGPLVYVIAHVVSLIRLSRRHRLGYLRGWNLYDVLMHFFLISAGVLWYIVFLQHQSLGFEQIISRRKRTNSDLLLWAEASFGIGCFLAIFRLTRWYLIHPVIGPFQTAYTGMIDNVLVVAFYLLWTLATFCVSTNIIYRPFKSLKKWDPKKDKWEEQPDDLADWEKLFITLFGLSDGVGPDQVEIYPANKTYTIGANHSEIRFVVNEHKFTNWVSKFFCAIFNIVIMSFLKDATIGLFAGSAGTMLENKYVEWRFVRMKEWLYYQDDTRFPPPLNLLPNLDCCRNMFKMRNSKHRGTYCDVIDEETQAGMRNRRNEYPYLMRRLFQRFFQQQKWTESEETFPTKKDKSNVEEKIQDLRKALGIGGDDDDDDSNSRGMPKPVPSSSQAITAAPSRSMPASQQMFSSSPSKSVPPANPTSTSTHVIHPATTKSQRPGLQTTTTSQFQNQQPTQRSTQGLSRYPSQPPPQPPTLPQQSQQGIRR